MQNGITPTPEKKSKRKKRKIFKREGRERGEREWQWEKDESMSGERKLKTWEKKVDEEIKNILFYFNKYFSHFIMSCKKKKLVVNSFF